VPGTIHWLSTANAIDLEVRLYDRLFRDEEPDQGDYRAALNPDSLQVIAGAKGEPGLAAAEPGARFQFERLGYFYREPEAAADGKLAFNRIVTLKDTWAKQVQKDTPRRLAESSGKSAIEVMKEGERQYKALERFDLLADSERSHELGSPSPPDTFARLAPEQRKIAERLRGAHGLTANDARILAAEPALLTRLEEGLAASGDARLLANWLVHEVVREAREQGRALAELPFDGAALAALTGMVGSAELSSTAARQVLAALVGQGGDPRAVAAALDVGQVSDVAALAPLVERVLAAAADNVNAYRQGRSGLLGWFVGQVMKESGGRANPQLARELLQARLDAPAPK
jgi:glutaminyl-tRNA synthetase